MVLQGSQVFPALQELKDGLARLEVLEILELEEYLVKLERLDRKDPKVNQDR
uniref:Uncharacterized protein n=1 Tax=Meloidogyne incognita TaxID=6306 RepID=A0A914MMU2_MELIC